MSKKRLENIDQLIRKNIHLLPNRASNMTAIEMCSTSYCIPPFKNFEGEIREAAQYKLSACVVQKSMSTLMTSIFCYLSNETRFINNNRDILRDWKIIRLCERKNEFRSLNGLFKRHQLANNSGWTHIMLTRHPIERFVSGFVDKCYRKPVKKEFCNGCQMNLTCFLQTEFQRMRSEAESRKFQKSFEDRHFFPQSWRCDLFRFFKNFTFIPYTSNTSKPITDELFKIFRKHEVPESSLRYIENALSTGRTAHSTVDSKATKFIQKRLLQSPYLMELLVRMFYHDFVAFNYTLPF
ncbi:unnamed protein product [Caenorhabditis bovis]|uniref:Carbohydrate sulfotransferase n=1 Tax=Caenorhabditis bovis TaxID=2654633 RepID=A0A8S1F4N3_9PELO|nr:unnamed protein product [Caenorhabditis bovis]